MLALTGTYYNGKAVPEKVVRTRKPMKVIITFLDAVESDSFNESKEYLNLSDFSFLEAQELLIDFKGSLSQTVIDERKNSL